MKKLIIILGFVIALTSCKKETLNPNAKYCWECANLPFGNGTVIQGYSDMGCNLSQNDIKSTSENYTDINGNPITPAYDWKKNCRTK
jgi:hypothetical protein